MKDCDEVREELGKLVDDAIEARARWRHSDSMVDPQYLEGYADGLEKAGQLLDEVQ